uniref:3-hydroxyacyl-CoA dehydrogenase NAD binding domain-containing protein n=1 Tax=Phytophthora ramorum TaxID=164328 RepID=H3GPH3_PHYRM
MLRPMLRSLPRATPSLLARALATSAGDVKIQKVGMVGLGLMGHGIAQTAASAGFDVVALDANPQGLESGMKRIEGSLTKLLSRGVKKGTITQQQADDQAAAALGRITPTTELQALADCDLVIEAIVENVEVKKEFYANLGQFEGATYPWGISKTQRCYNLSCWDNRASSVKWEGLPTSGSFSGKSRIAFFTGKDCTGDSRDWPTDGYINDKKGNYPMDFTLDGINDGISSFIVWETSKRITNGKDTPCPWGTS